jgi:hypothetical protein
MLHRTIINVSGRIAGGVFIDPAAIRGEGGPLDPRLVVPITIECHGQGADACLEVW